jgi:TolB-like protein
VLPFHIISKQEKDSWMSKGIQEALMTDLRKIAGLQLLERSQLDALMQEHDLQASDLVQENGITSFDGQLGAGVAVLGSLQSQNGKIRIDARMVLIDSGKVILATLVEGREADLLLLENKLANQIADKLNINLTDYEKQRLSQPDTTSVATLESQFSQELGKEEMQAQLQEYKESSGRLAGHIMIAASTVVTIFAGGTAFKHYMDRSDYESESNSELASRKGDVADQSYGAMVVSVGAAIAAWVATGAFYLWDKLVD